MKSKWFKVMIPLLILVLTAAYALASDVGSVTVQIPFTVEFASGTVVMEAVADAPAPEQAEFPGVEEGSFAVTLTEPGNYKYKIYQEPGTDERFRYDETVYTVELFVTTDEVGTLSASVTVGVEDSSHKPDSVAFENERRTGALSITKTVTGSHGDTGREWHFLITLSEKADKLYGGVWFDTGVARVTLKHGETLTVEGLPMGATYEVTEVEADKDGYKTTFTGATGTIGDGTVVEVACVNEKGAPTPTTNPPETDNPQTSDNPQPTDATTTSGIAPTATPSANGTAAPGASNTTPPKTGDESMLMVWVGLAAFSLIAIVLILLVQRKRRAGDRTDG